MVIQQNCLKFYYKAIRDTLKIFLQAYTVPVSVFVGGPLRLGSSLASLGWAILPIQKLKDQVMSYRELDIPTMVIKCQ